MTSYDPRLVRDPTEIPPDAQIIAENADRVRRGEIEALLVERDAARARRASITAKKPDPRLVVVDEQGNDTGLRAIYRNEAEQHADLEKQARQLDEELKIIGRELKARGHGAT